MPEHSFVHRSRRHTRALAGVSPELAGLPVPPRSAEILAWLLLGRAARTWPKTVEKRGFVLSPERGKGKGGGPAVLQAMQAESWAGGVSVQRSGGQPASLAPVLAESSLICSLLVLQAARTVSKGSGFFPLIHKNLALWSVTKKSTSGRLINTLVRNRASCTSSTSAAFTARCVFCTHLFTGLTRHTHRYFVLQVVALA